MKLILQDGTVYAGESFGAREGVVGEVVFNTAMSGYVEALTDPSYRGQILVLTYPLIGNYGVPPAREAGSLGSPFESDRIQVQGLVVQHYSRHYSHHAASRSLAEWLQAQNVPAITGVDTRALTRHLRAAGTMQGSLIPGGEAGAADDGPLREMDMRHELFLQVSPPVATWHGAGRHTVLLVDVGAKDNILRSLLKRGLRVVRVPWHQALQPYYEQVDGVVIGNGPGDPAHLDSLVRQIAWMLAQGDKPLFGICLGHQLLARAIGARTYKLPYGHRGVNQPVRDQTTGRCFITSQNHGYAVDSSSLPEDWENWFVNLNDGSNEGIRCSHRPCFSVQFHPEARPGPEDSAYLFDDFLKLLRRPVLAQEPFA